MTRQLRASYAFCSELSRREAKNFYYSFLVLPPGRRRAMCALYAFLRHTDDLADGEGIPGDKLLALALWRANLVAAISGEENSWPGLPALADTIRKYAIPVRHLHDVIDGVSMDLYPTYYSTFEDLRKYCYHVASAVGLACIHIWGYQSQSGNAEKLAESCGIALQLTNIVRDVREDAEKGRVYLPLEDLKRFDLCPEDLFRPRPPARLRELLRFEGARAYDLYRESQPLVGLVSPVGRPVLRSIVGIYRALLDEIARRDYDVMSQRVSVGSWRKAAITLSSLAGHSHA